MDKLKQYVLLTVLGCMVVLAAGWFLLVSPKRSDAEALNAQAASQVSANAQLDNQLEVLKAQAKDLPKQQAKLAAVAAKIPDNPGLPGLVRALTTAGTSAGIELVSVAPGPPALVGATGTQAVGPGSSGATTSASVAGTLASIPVTLNVVGGYFQVEQFVASLESLPRAMRVSSISLAPGANPVKPAAAGTSVDSGKVLTTAITAQVFMAADRPAATTAVAPGAVPNGPVAPAAPAN